MKKLAPIICAVVFIALLGVWLGVIIYPLLTSTFTGGVVTGILIVYGLLIIAMMVGIVIALRQRLKEIEGGEEDAASQY